MLAGENMKVFLITLLKFGLRLIYLPMKLFKTKNQIVYLSRQRNQKDEDISLLEEEIRKQSPDTKQVFRLKMIDGGIIAKIKYGFYIIGDMYYLATSKVAIVDTYSITVSVLNHKKSLKVIQMWHALGAIKKFGYQAFGTKEGRDEKVSLVMCMHRNYDYVLAPSEATAVFYKEAFNVDASKIKICPMPRVDFITDGQAPYERFYSMNTALSEKKIVLYLPTFRKRDSYASQLLKAEFENDEQYSLIIKAHPLSEMKLEDKFSYKGDFTTFELMKIADIIVTDYSACAFEASLLMKPLYFFVPDFDEYIRYRGLNVDVRKEMPDAVFDDGEKLFQSIKQNAYNMNELFEFKNKYIKLTNDKATAVLARFIVNLIGE